MLDLLLRFAFMGFVCLGIFTFVYELVASLLRRRREQSAQNTLIQNAAVAAAAGNTVNSSSSSSNNSQWLANQQQSVQEEGIRRRAQRQNETAERLRQQYNAWQQVARVNVRDGRRVRVAPLENVPANVGVSVAEIERNEVRAQQELDLAMALSADAERERVARQQQEGEEMRRSALLTRMQKRKALVERRQAYLDALPNEPESGTLAATIAVRMADGKRLTRTFEANASVGDIKRFVEGSQPTMASRYKLLTGALPKRALTDDEQTIEAESLLPRALLHVEEIPEEEEEEEEASKASSSVEQ
jgi:UBX domain